MSKFVGIPQDLTPRVLSPTKSGRTSYLLMAIAKVLDP